MLNVLTLAILGYSLHAPPSTTRGRSISFSARRTQLAPVASLNRRVAVNLGLGAAAITTTFVPPAFAADFPKIKMDTTEGTMEFELYDDLAPKHVESFLKLTKQGFFDGGAFHRIIPGFVIQGGDPNAKVGYGKDGKLESGDKGLQRKWGTGGPGYNVPAEFNERIHEFGVLSMARANDPNSAGSQFFVCLGRLTSLDNKYTVFGKLTSGEDVLKRIAAAQRDSGDRPLIRQGIQEVNVIAAAPPPPPPPAASAE